MAITIDIHADVKTMKTLRRSVPISEKKNHPFQLSFDGSLRIDFQGSRAPSADGLILVRELDERFTVESRPNPVSDCSDYCAHARRPAPAVGLVTVWSAFWEHPTVP
jgi:hypothetical protein